MAWPPRWLSANQKCGMTAAGFEQTTFQKDFRMKWRATVSGFKPSAHNTPNLEKSWDLGGCFSPQRRCDYACLESSPILTNLLYRMFCLPRLPGCQAAHLAEVRMVGYAALPSSAATQQSHLSASSSYAALDAFSHESPGR